MQKNCILTACFIDIFKGEGVLVFAAGKEAEQVAVGQGAERLPMFNSPSRR